MIELTSEQASTLEQLSGVPVKVRHPHTQQVFVLVPEDVHELMQRWAGVFNRAGWDDPALDVYEEEQNKP